MGEVVSYVKTAIDELLLDAEIVGTDLVLTKMSGEVVTLSLGAVASVDQADIDAAVAALVNSAPGTLDTLGEIATALGNDANLASTLTTSIASKASAAALATEVTDRAAADTVLTAAQLTVTANNQTGTAYGLVLADAGKVVELNNAATVTVTVPTNASVAFPIGTVIELFQQGAGQVVVAAAGGVTIRSTEGKLKLYGQYAGASLRKRAADEWVLVGDLVA